MQFRGASMSARILCAIMPLLGGCNHDDDIKPKGGYLGLATETIQVTHNAAHAVTAIDAWGFKTTGAYYHLHLSTTPEPNTVPVTLHDSKNGPLTIIQDAMAYNRDTTVTISNNQNYVTVESEGIDITLSGKKHSRTMLNLNLNKDMSKVVYTKDSKPDNNLGQSNMNSVFYAPREFTVN